jgi:hypothetical protein
MVRAEATALSRTFPQDGNELNSMENLNGKTNQYKIYFFLLVRGEKMRYARLRGGESPPPIISDFCDILDSSLRIANFGLLTSGSPTCWHLEIVIKPRNASFETAGTVSIVGSDNRPGRSCIYMLL